MDNVVRFVSKSELERERLIREARAIYDSIFPRAIAADKPDGGRSEQTTTDIASNSLLNPSSAHGRSDTR
ncbi:hypothetical protein [Bradyrhizobium sp. CCGUVB23]|uniref:hypothetical protein n=1 Tax=Bradyrhizobium sp. CCGUVB23 TaxID=2949630 RepID=UPI0020B26BA4|nr:hypothetical protein [Bradyrhizobium sp. CCGUVB23]MCP3463538.1 hypothetical protein [Bradyrhizobium sp. CCGUVB23]